MAKAKDLGGSKEEAKAEEPKLSEPQVEDAGSSERRERGRSKARLKATQVVRHVDAEGEERVVNVGDYVDEGDHLVSLHPHVFERVG